MCGVSVFPCLYFLLRSHDLLQYARVTVQVVVLPTCYSCQLLLQRVVCRIELFIEWIKLSLCSTRVNNPNLQW